MIKVKTVFSIKDLENLSGAKAHTIRIWGQRYDLLKPKRTEHNFRFYDIDCLKKLLNVSYLNQHGLKVSKIAEFSDTDIKRTVREIAVSGKMQSYAVNALKLAMINFDQSLFYSI
jgi:DNA-binding transcriptional MerR regulator